MCFVNFHIQTTGYDHQGRMVWKETTDLTANHYPLTITHYTWDGWNIIAETTTPLTPSSLLPTISFYVWGLDLSGTLQGAGGVGGLLAVIKDGGVYLPCYDANGNITEYVDTNGVIVAHREYDAFGNTVAEYTNPSVSNSNSKISFTHWFSTKPWCEIISASEYLFRIYAPSTGRRMSRDPIEEEGGFNLYGFVENDPIPEGFQPPKAPKGSFHNPKTGESLRPDMNHPPPKPPHWGYKPGKKSPWQRVFEDGCREPHSVPFSHPPNIA